MNGTIPIYTQAQTSVIPLASLVLPSLVSLPIYLVAKHRSDGAKNLKSRAFLFYKIISGVLLGQVLGLFFKVIAGALVETLTGPIFWTSFFYMPIFAGLGYFFLDTSEDVGRWWTFNPNQIGPSDYADADDIGLNHKTGEENTVTVSDDLQGEAFQKAVFLKHDQFKDERKRQWMLGCLLVIFFISSFVQGLQLIYRYPKTEYEVAQIITCYFINALALSFVVFGVMIHAKIHVIEGKCKRVGWWIALTLLWSVIHFSGSLMLLIPLDWSVAAFILRHPATNVFYGLAAGILLKMQAYFHNMKIDGANGCEMVGGRFIFLIALGQALVTNIWL